MKIKNKRPLLYVPLPDLIDLFWAIRKPLSDQIIARPWCRDGDHSLWVSQSAYSLQIIAEACLKIKNKKSILIWVPDYFCNSSLEPMRRTNCDIVFYPITKDLVPNLEWCKLHIFNKPPDIFILVHYWGQPSSGKLMSEICKKSDTLLVEDATHALKPIPGIGEYGDFVIYSPHKHLPIIDGALLVVAKDCQHVLSRNGISIETILNVLADSQKTTYSSISHPIIWLVKRLLQMIGFRKKNSKTRYWPEYQSGGLKCEYYKMSSSSKRMLSLLYDKLDAIAKKRNYYLMLWQDHLGLKEYAGRQILSCVMRNTPYQACFKYKDTNKIQGLFSKLISKGFPVSTWPDLPPEVVLNPVEHKIAIDLRRTRFYLQVNQSLSANNIIHLCSSYGDKLNEGD